MIKFAFPKGTYEDGMTLLDYFAGQALVGLIGKLPHKEAVKSAYEIAQYMMDEREKILTQ